MRSNKLLLAIIGLLLVSCSTTRIIEFSEKEDEIFTTEDLKEFLSQNENPKVVLRAPFVANQSDISSAEFNKEVYDNEIYNDFLYAAIENVFLKNGFIVRDRKLFESVAKSASLAADYEKISQSSDTDLIVELVRIEPNVVYKTNKYKDSKNREHTTYADYERVGAYVEFKVVMLKNAVFAGSYKFHYTPCTNGCPVELSARDREKARRERMENEKRPYEGLELPLLEEFIKNATSQLIESMR